MGSSEKFRLRWNDFERNISVAFREIRDDNDFFDVTLSCGDREIQAHKLILSACSSFFRGVLRRNPHPHPLLYLKGVDYSDLQAVLNFMYHGEVNVSQEELHSFLAVAEDLKVKGLTEKNQNSSSGSDNIAPRGLSQLKTDSTKRPRLGRDVNDRDPSPSSAAKRPCPSLTPVLTPVLVSCASEDDDIQEVVVPIVKSTVPVEPLPPASQTLGTVAHSGDDSYGYDGCDEAEVDEYDDAMMESGDGNKGNEACMITDATHDDDHSESSIIDEDEIFIERSIEQGERSKTVGQSTVVQLKFPPATPSISSPQPSTVKTQALLQDCLDSLGALLHDPDNYNLVPDDSFTSADSQGTAMSPCSTGYLTDPPNSPSVASVTSIQSADLGGSWDGQGQQSQIKDAQSLSTPKNYSEYDFQDDNGNEKIVLTKSDCDQAKLKNIFSSFSREMMKGSVTLWECTQCEKKFKTKRLVDSHIDFKHTDHLIHQCLKCGRCLPTNDALTRHIGSAHSLKLNLERSNDPSIVRVDLDVRTSTRVGALAWIQMQEGIMKSQLLKSSDEQLDLEVGQFGVSGRGVITTRDRLKGEFVVEYAGELIDLSSAMEREKQYLDEEAGCYMYYFKHDGKQYCVDATAESGRLGRLINHSKAHPNLVTKVIAMEGGPRLVLIAKKDISKGSQLKFDYGDRDKETLKAHPWLDQ